MRPEPSVRGMPEGREEGMTHPKKARARMDRSILKGLPSEISNSMRGVETKVVIALGARATREPTKAERIARRKKNLSKWSVKESEFD